MSIGDMLAGLHGPNPAPNPSPLPPQGSPPAAAQPAAMGAQPQPQPLPPAQTYAPDPTIGASIQKLMDMEQQARRANGIDRGLAMMAGSFGPVSTRAAIMGSAQPQADPIRNMGGAIADQAGLMQVEQQQRMLDAMHSGALGQALGIGGTSGGIGAAGGPAPANDPAAALLQFGTPQQVQEYLAQRAQAGTQTQTKQQEEKNTDLLEAQQKAPGAIVQMSQIDDLSNSVRNAVEADGKTPVLQSIMESSTKKFAAGEFLDAPAEPGVIENAKLMLAKAGLTPAEQAAVMNLKQLRGQIYGEAFTSTGSRRTQQEVQNIKTGIDPLGNFNQNYGDYMKQFDRFQNTVHKGMANTFGAAGLLDDPRLVPHRDLVDPTYLPKGPLYAGQGGNWASETAAAPSPTSTAIHAPADFAPAPAVTYLKAHPELAQQFDAKYGAGASKQALGQ